MGYGKTTAVREFLALKGVPVIWTCFLSEDDTARGFGKGLRPKSAGLTGRRRAGSKVSAFLPTHRRQLWLFHHQ